MAKAEKKYGPKYKFGTRVPRTIQEAFTLDKENKDDSWRQAFDKEIQKIKFPCIF